MFLCVMLQLNFPTYSFRFKNSENKRLIFDSIRKKFVVLTPEEWVRQHTIRFIVEHNHIPASHLSVERELILNQTKKRYDVVVFNSDGGIDLIVECKAPSIAITQSTFDQIARYNLVTQARYLMVTNGLNHYFCKLDYEGKQYVFLDNFPLLRN